MHPSKNAPWAVTHGAFCVLVLLDLAQAVVHGSEHGLAGHGRAGNSIHAVGGTSLGQGICQGLGSSAAQLIGEVTLRVDVYTNYGKPNQQVKSLTLRLKNVKDTFTVGEIEF